MFRVTIQQRGGGNEVYIVKDILQLKTIFVSHDMDLIFLGILFHTDILRVRNNRFISFEVRKL